MSERCIHAVIRLTPGNHDEVVCEACGKVFAVVVEWKDELTLAAFSTPPTVREWKMVPVEPTEAMLDTGSHVNSEWLNDNAPIGERLYRFPAKAVYAAMLAASPASPSPPRDAVVAVVEALEQKAEECATAIKLSSMLYAPETQQTIGYEQGLRFALAALEQENGRG